MGGTIREGGGPILPRHHPVRCELNSYDKSHPVEYMGRGNVGMGPTLRNDGKYLITMSMALNGQYKYSVLYWALVAFFGMYSYRNRGPDYNYIYYTRKKEI